MAVAVSALPQLFAALALVDPIIYPPDWLRAQSEIFLHVSSALVRRDVWKSRSEAYANFAKKTNFFGRWTEDSLRRYVEFCLVDRSTFGGENNGVELKTRKFDEAVGSAFLLGRACDIP
jgi:hypothetical protein